MSPTRHATESPYSIYHHLQGVRHMRGQRILSRDARVLHLHVFFAWCKTYK